MVVYTFLTACAPALNYTTLPKPEQTIIAGAAGGRAVFGEYQTYYEQIGSRGPAVLLVHGIGGGSSVFQYRKNAQAIANAGYRVWAMDLLGFGRSSRPAVRYSKDLHRRQIEAFIRDVIKEPTILVANGVSAAYSIKLAAEQPALVSRLILIGPTGLERQTRQANQFFYDVITGVGPLVFGLFVTPQCQRFFLDQVYFSDASYTPEVVESIDFNLKAESAQWVVYSFIVGDLDQPVKDYWPRLTQSTLLLWGEADGFTSAGDARAFLEQRPSVRSEVIKGAKLLPNEDTPEAFNRLVLDFLARQRKGYCENHKGRSFNF